MFKATVIAHSVNTYDQPIITIEAQYPRFIHSEVMTHRVFSRNAMSSRAIPVARMIQQVRENPAMPVHWGRNQPGMQAAVELTDLELETAKSMWYRSAWEAANIAEEMVALGLHKQVANRILEPFQWMRTLITSTEWDNFFALRMHPDAQPEFQLLATLIHTAIAESTPIKRWQSGPDSWHLPYVRDDERKIYREDVLLKLSTARCARVSYLTHDGADPDIGKDLELYERLVGAQPIHASPCEHQAQPAKYANDRSRNFVGWVQHRTTVEASLPQQ